MLYLPGIEGYTSVDQWWLRGLRDGQFQGEVKIIDWTERETGISALQAHARNHQRGRGLAKQITAIVRAHPSRELILCTYSGGAGVGVWALEALPADIKVTTWLALAPALSPRYDLTRALQHVAGNAYVFYSENDTLILGAGTRQFGTIDGVKGDAAGLVGFVRPPEADRREYAKLRSFPYKDEWVQWGNWGGHDGDMSRAFAEHVLAPLLRHRDPETAADAARGGRVAALNLNAMSGGSPSIAPLASR